MKKDIRKEYFDWMYVSMGGNKHGEGYTFEKLLTALHETEFTYSIEKDSNRASDGVGLRRRFAHAHDYSYSEVEEVISGPCSVLEMMIALAIRCEENIMDNPQYGDRTSQWFWRMIVNLGLGAQYDKLFDKHIFDIAINRFLNREYAANGTGGLFKIRNCKHDLRKIEIWQQLCWYTNDLN